MSRHSRRLVGVFAFYTYVKGGLIMKFYAVSCVFVRVWRHVTQGVCHHDHCSLGVSPRGKKRTRRLTRAIPPTPRNLSQKGAW